MEIHILVQGISEDAAAFANRIETLLKTMSTEKIEVSFTSALDGRQTCNIVWNPYKIVKVIMEGV